MIVLHSCSFVENGSLEYVLVIEPSADETLDYTDPNYYTALNGNEIIINNNTITPYAGAGNISGIEDVNFYAMYKT